MIFFTYCNLRSKCLHSSFCGKVEAEQGGRGRREGRAGQGKRGNLFLLLSSQLSSGTCTETLATQAVSAMMTCLRSSSLCFSNPLLWKETPVLTLTRLSSSFR